MTGCYTLNKPDMLLSPEVSPQKDTYGRCIVGKLCFMDKDACIYMYTAIRQFIKI